MKKTSAIICAYNNESTIKDIVSTVCDYFFAEVIVVNDGSSDKTDIILKQINDFYNFKYIPLFENKGKGHAMAIGIENTNAEIIVFIDADLSNLQDRHLAQLIMPLQYKEADMVFGQAAETLIDYKINPCKSLIAEMSFFKKDILPILDDLKSTKIKVETLHNSHYQYHQKRVKYVMLEGLKIAQ
ncbi:MAG: glycosyltransferase family 2 protein [Paludibacter sp.]|nr:glycosyltransferase family 2 protein [Paludibacter sp.]